MFLDPIFRMTSTAPHAVSCIMAHNKSGQGGKRAAICVLLIAGCWARVKTWVSWTRVDFSVQFRPMHRASVFPSKGSLLKPQKQDGKTEPTAGPPKIGCGYSPPR